MPKSILLYYLVCKVYRENIDRTLHAGTVLVFRTTEGHYGKMKIIGFRKKRGISRKYGIHVKWELF